MFWSPGPLGVGKATHGAGGVVHRRLVELDGPGNRRAGRPDRLRTVKNAVGTVCDGGGVLLIADIDALLPATRNPLRH